MPQQSPDVLNISASELQGWGEEEDGERRLSDEVIRHS